MKAIFSFDYELFFGSNSGTVQKSIIEPTNILLDCLENNGLRGSFFIDYMMFKTFEKTNDVIVSSDLVSIKSQICDIVRRGHRIELHIHPHWIDAKYNGDGTWNFDEFKNYSLAAIPEESVLKILAEGKEYLENLARSVSPDYQIIAFRAGGWAIQPFSHLRNAFIKLNIKVDSSASYGHFNSTKNCSYDYRRMPRKCLYRFENDVCIEDKNGAFLEVPITSFHYPVVLFLYDWLCRKLPKDNRPYSDGTHIRFGEHKTIWKKITDRFVHNRGMLNFSGLSFLSIEYGIKKNRTNVICFIDHPKDLSLGAIKRINQYGRRFESISYIDLI